MKEPSTFLKRGRLLATDNKLRAGIIWFKENLPLAYDALQKYRCENVDGEFRIIGRKGHLWEYGIGKLGISVEGNRKIKAFETACAGLVTRTQRGDDEANYMATWTPEVLTKLVKVLRIVKRRSGRSDAFAKHRQNMQISTLEGVRTLSMGHTTPCQTEQSTNRANG